MSATTQGVPPFDFAPLGDSAFLLRTTAAADVASLLEARERITTAAIPGVAEVVTGYASIAVYFDLSTATDAGAPLGEFAQWVEAQVSDALRSSGPAPAKEERLAVEILICADAEFALDLDEMARHTGLSEAQVIRIYTGAIYSVRCVGFTPGFAYLSGLPAELMMPRRATPRTKVPAGSVAIGGPQTGIYPVASPGGWNVIGRTPLRLFDPQRDPPSLLRTGDRVRFRAITLDEFFAAAIRPS